MAETSKVMRLVIGYGDTVFADTVTTLIGEEYPDVSVDAEPLDADMMEWRIMADVDGEDESMLPLLMGVCIGCKLTLKDLVANGLL